MRHPLGYGMTLAAVLVAGFLAFAGPASAQDFPAGDLARVSVSSAGVDFWPEIEHGGAVLKVSSGGEVLSYSFASGETPSVGVFGPEGEPLPDGVYQWELELLPTPEARRELMISATKNGGQAPEAREPQSGAFAVVDGFIVDPDLEEAGARSEFAEPTGFGLESSEARIEGERAKSDRSAELDADSGLCESAAKFRSGSCDAAVRETLASSSAEPFTSGIVMPERAGFGDTDLDVAAGGLPVAEIVRLDQASEAGETTTPRRFFDPEGANGRPRSEEDQR